MRHRRQLALGLPGRLEAGIHVRFGPAIGVQDFVDEGVEAGAIAIVEADRKARVFRDALRGS